MSEREFDTDEIPVIELGTNNSQPLTTAEMAGVAAAAIPRQRLDRPDHG